jgi:methylmalonyl-CoA mutase
VIVGVNKYRLEEEPPIDILDIDNARVREAAGRAPAKMRADPRRGGVRRRARGADRRRRARHRQPAGARIEAARARATWARSRRAGSVFGRHRATIRSISGVYAAAYDGDRLRAAHPGRRRRLRRREGRRPRMLVAKMGQDGHDRGAKVIATAFADIGFDVDVGPLFQTPEEAARQAIENDVHVVGVSSPGRRPQDAGARS